MVSYRPVCKQDSLEEFQSFMPVSVHTVQRTMTEDMLTHESFMKNFVNSLLDTKKSNALSGEKVYEVAEYLRDPGCKIDPNFKHWIAGAPGFKEYKERIKFSISIIPIIMLNKYIIWYFSMKSL